MGGDGRGSVVYNRGWIRWWSGKVHAIARLSGSVLNEVSLTPLDYASENPRK
jgi:hypothetical protein